jgi:hypothetical protein
MGWRKESDGTRHLWASLGRVTLSVSSRPVWRWEFFEHLWFGWYSGAAPGTPPHGFRKLSCPYALLSVDVGLRPGWNLTRSQGKFYNNVRSVS